MGTPFPKGVPLFLFFDILREFLVHSLEFAFFSAVGEIPHGDGEKGVDAYHGGIGQKEDLPGTVDAKGVVDCQCGNDRHRAIGCPIQPPLGGGLGGLIKQQDVHHRRIQQRDGGGQQKTVEGIVEVAANGKNQRGRAEGTEIAIDKIKASVFESHITHLTFL